MPDPIQTTVPSPAQQPVSSPTGAAGVPTPAPAVPPVSPPASTQEETVPLRPDTVVNVRDANGRLVPANLGSMAQAFLDQQAASGAPAVPPEDIEKFNLFQKAVKENDTQAMLALVQPPTQPVSPETPGTISDPRVDEMQGTIEKLKQQLEASTVVTGRISQEAESAAVRQFVENNAASYPFLAHAVTKQPGYADSVRVARQTILAQAQKQVEAGGGDWNTFHSNNPNIAQNSLIMALNQIENSVKQFAGVFGVNAGATPAPVAVNDQQATGSGAQKSADHIPPRFVFNRQTHQYERPGEQPVTNGQPVPPNPVPPGVGGAPMVAAPLVNGPVNLDGFKSRLRGQSQSLSQAI